jgi:hypothetical protein
MAILAIALLLGQGVQWAPFHVAANNLDAIGIDAKVVYAHVNSAISCPMRPCDSSGFALIVVSRNGTAMLTGYEICQVAGGFMSSCVRSEALLDSIIVAEFVLSHNDISSISGTSVFLGKNKDWNAGDTIDIRIMVMSTKSPTSSWIGLGRSQIAEVGTI